MARIPREGSLHKTASATFFANPKFTALRITYPDAQDVALCYDWIDSQSGSHDDDYQARAFTPRRNRSRRSQVNSQHVERLTSEGRMRESGLAKVERAKADGRWEAAYRMSTDEDFQAALNANYRAKTFWESLGMTQRFAFLFTLMGIKRPETETRQSPPTSRCWRGEKFPGSPIFKCNQPCITPRLCCPDLMRVYHPSLSCSTCMMPPEYLSSSQTP